MREAILEKWHEYSEPLEGRVPHMYQCTAGLVTVGVGNAIDTLGQAMRLKWEAYDGGPAYPHEVEAEWLRVKAMPRGLYHKQYKAPRSPYLSDETIDELVVRQLLLNEAYLKKRFPAWDTWPTDAQMATLSLAWAVGASLAAWPKFRAACHHKHWLKAAKESHLKEGNNPGVVDRNKAQKLMLENAYLAERNPKATPPDKLWWPLDLEAKP